MSRLLRAKVLIPLALGLVLAVYLLDRSRRWPTLPLALSAIPLRLSRADFNLQYEDVSFTPRGGSLTLRGWLLPGSPQAPYLIFVHGIGDQRTGNHALDLASRLVKDDGYNVLLFDLRAQGLSDGNRVTAGQEERYDVLGAYDFLLSRGAQPGRVGLIGRSYGAAIARRSSVVEQPIRNRQAEGSNPPAGSSTST